MTKKQKKETSVRFETFIEGAKSKIGGVLANKPEGYKQVVDSLTMELNKALVMFYELHKSGEIPSANMIPQKNPIN